MADKRIDQLTAAATMGDNDLLVLQQNNQAKKLPGSVLSDYVYKTISGAVADAAAVGELKTAMSGVDALLPIGIKWVDGAYIDASGDLVESSDFHYSEPIKADELTNIYRVWFGNTGNGNSTIRIHGYDKNGSWVKQLNSLNANANAKKTFLSAYTYGIDSFRISCSKTKIEVFGIDNVYGLGIKEAAIQDATVIDRKGVFGTPSIDYYSKIQEADALTAKCVIFSGENSYCIVFQENLDGTAVDVPSTSGSGVIALRYKYFTLNNGEETNVSYGTIAQKGSTYTDINNASKTFAGGVGKPGGNNNVLFMTAADTGTHRYNGTNNYGMTSCCCSVTVTDSGVTFGTIKEMSLTIDNTSGKLDVLRLDPLYSNYYIYYTTTAPAYKNGTWHWLLPVVYGFIYLTSTNGLDWVYQKTIKTPFQIYAEIQCETISDTVLIFAARCEKDDIYYNPLIGNYTAVGILNTDGYIAALYKLPGGRARPFLAKYSGTQFLLLNNSTDRRDCEGIYIETRESNTQLVFYKIFEYFKRATWYPSTPRIISDDNVLVICGTDGPPAIGTASTFITVSLPDPRMVSDVDFTIV